MGISLAALPGAAAAQEARDQCDAEVVRRQDPLQLAPGVRRYHPLVLYEGVRPLLGEDRHADALRVVRTEFAARPAGAVSSEERRRMLEHLDALIGVVGRARRVSDAVRLIEDGRPAAAGRELRAFDIAYVASREVYRLFADDPAPIEIDDTTPVERRRAICWTAIAVQQITADYRVQDIAEAAEIMQGVRREWERYGEHRYSMYPWESLLFNIRPLRRGCVETNLGPPRCAPILLHPNPGYEVGAIEAPTGDSDVSRLRSQQVIEWDLIGFVWYQRDWSSYRGIAVIMLTSPGQPPAFGPAVHIGQSLEIGAAFRRRTESDGFGRSVFLSVDAYRFASALPARFSRTRDLVERLVERAARGALRTPGL